MENSRDNTNTDKGDLAYQGYAKALRLYVI